MRPITTLSRWRESARLTCEPDFCNLPSHSAPRPCDCLRDEKAILERAAVWKKPPSRSVALVVRASRGSAEVKGIMITPQPRRSLDGLHIPPWPHEERLMMKLDRSADRQERFVKARIAVARFRRFSSTRWGSVFSFLFVLGASRILILSQMWFEAFQSHRWAEGWMDRWHQQFTEEQKHQMETNYQRFKMIRLKVRTTRTNTCDSTEHCWASCCSLSETVRCHCVMSLRDVTVWRHCVLSWVALSTVSMVLKLWQVKCVSSVLKMSFICSSVAVTPVSRTEQNLGLGSGSLLLSPCCVFIDALTCLSSCLCFSTARDVFMFHVRHDELLRTFRFSPTAACLQTNSVEFSPTVWTCSTESVQEEDGLWLTVLEMVGSLVRDEESLLRDRRSQQVMSPPSLLELRLGSVGLAGTTRSAGLCGSAGVAAGPRAWKTQSVSEAVLDACVEGFHMESVFIHFCVNLHGGISSEWNVTTCLVTSCDRLSLSIHPL